MYNFGHYKAEEPTRVTIFQVRMRRKSKKIGKGEPFLGHGILTSVWTSQAKIPTFASVSAQD